MPLIINFWDVPSDLRHEGIQEQAQNRLIERIQRQYLKLKDKGENKLKWLVIDLIKIIHDCIAGLNQKVSVS